MPRIYNARDLGLALRERRREHGWSQQALADRLGVSRQWIVEIEKGKPRAEIGLILRTIAALDLRMIVESPSDALMDSTARVDRDRDDT